MTVAHVGNCQRHSGALPSPHPNMPEGIRRPRALRPHCKMRLLALRRSGQHDHATSSALPSGSCRWLPRLPSELRALLSPRLIMPSALHAGVMQGLAPAARGAADAADAPALLGDVLGGAQEAAAAPVHGRQRRLHAARAPRPEPSCTALVWGKSAVSECMGGRMRAARCSFFFQSLPLYSPRTGKF